jgi:DNA-binding MarR family transcriptional regulator
MVLKMNSSQVGNEAKKRETLYDLRFSDMNLTTWALMRQTWSIMYKAAESRLNKVGLTPEKLAVLWICRDYPGILTTAEIARFLSRQSQSVTGLLNRMEEEELVTRNPKRKGRPFTEVKLTTKGEELCHNGIAVIRDLISVIAPALSEGDQQQLQKLLGALRQSVIGDLKTELTRPPDFAAVESIPVKW